LLDDLAFDGGLSDAFAPDPSILHASCLSARYRDVSKGFCHVKYLARTASVVDVEGDHQATTGDGRPYAAIGKAVGLS